jgi:hypothetical protein
VDDKLTARRAEQWQTRMMEMMRHRLLQVIRQEGLKEQELAAIAHQIALNQQNPYTLVERMVEQVLQGAKHGTD